MAAAAASWIEALGLPLREIEERYTRSEVALMAWRSQEQGHQMRLKMKTGGKPTLPVDSKVEHQIAALERFSEKLKKPLTDDEGMFTVKHQSGEDALKVFEMMGLQFPRIQ
jgi:hypothetical protein